MASISIEVIGDHVSELRRFSWPADFRQENSVNYKELRSLQTLSEADENNIVLAGSRNMLG